MKNKFIIDENVYMTAQTGTNPKGEDDASAMYLILSIFENCHGIVFNEILKNKYDQKEKMLKSGRYLIGFDVMKFIRHAYTNKNKGQCINCAKIQFENEVPEDDLFLIRLAITAGAIIVTDDERLKRKIEQSSLKKTYPSLQLLSPKEAIRYTPKT